MSFRGNLKRGIALRLEEVLQKSFHLAGGHDQASHGVWSEGVGDIGDDPEMQDFLTKALNKRGVRTLRFDSPTESERRSMSDKALIKHYVDQGFDKEESRFLAKRARSFSGDVIVAHGDHDQASHGNWADGSGRVTGMSAFGNAVRDAIESDHSLDTRAPTYIYNLSEGGTYLDPTPPEKMVEVRGASITKYWSGDGAKNAPEWFKESKGQELKDKVAQWVTDRYKFDHKEEYKANLSEAERNQAYKDIAAIKKGDLSRLPAVIDVMQKTGEYAYESKVPPFSEADISAEKDPVGQAQLKMFNLLQGYKEYESYATYHSSYNEASIAQEKLMSGSTDAFKHSLRVIDGYTSSYEGGNAPTFDDPNTWDKIAASDKKLPGLVNKRKEGSA